MERGREWALSSWPTSSVIMPWSRNEAFGSTPGFWEQRCELLMLAVGPAWHPLPFPSSPCLGQLPAPPSPHWNCKEDQNKERDLFFTRLLLWPNDITSAASSPQIPAAQRIFPFLPSTLHLIWIPPFYTYIKVGFVKKKTAWFMLCVFLMRTGEWVSSFCKNNNTQFSLKTTKTNRKQQIRQMDALTLSFRALQTVSLL